MYLAQDRVRNFRDLRGMAVEFDEGLNVLVGENNIGKTNLLDVVRAGLGAAAGLDSLRLAPDDRFIDAAGEITQDPMRIDLSDAVGTLPSGLSNRLARALAARAVEQMKATREGLGGDE